MISLIYSSFKSGSCTLFEILTNNSNDENEYLLKKNSKRFVLFPIVHNDIYELYKRAESSFWTANEIDLSKDINDWEKLSYDEQNFEDQIAQME